MSDAMLHPAQKKLVFSLLAAFGICSAGLLFCVYQIDNNSPRKMSSDGSTTQIEVTPGAKVVTGAAFLGTLVSGVSALVVFLKKWGPIAGPVVNTLSNGKIQLPDLNGLKLPDNISSLLNIQDLAKALAAELQLTHSTGNPLTDLLDGVPIEVREIVAAAIAVAAKPDDKDAEKRFIMALLSAAADYIGTKNPKCQEAVSLVASEAIAVLFAPTSGVTPPTPGKMIVQAAARA